MKELDRLKMQVKELHDRLEVHKETKSLYMDAAHEADELVEQWEELKDLKVDGKAVYPPKSDLRAKKRKGENLANASRKRQKQSSDDEDSDFIARESDSSSERASEDGVSVDDVERGKELTEGDINLKLQELKVVRKESREKKREIVEEMSSLRSTCKKAEDRQMQISNDISALCILGRNDYSKGAIQQDFAAGMKELDQEIACEEMDPDNFDPKENTRDYEEVARKYSAP